MLNTQSPAPKPFPVYDPVKCGELAGYSKATVYGFTYDASSLLIALSVQAPSITVEQIHYTLQGQDKSVTLDSTGSHARYVGSKKSHYKVFKTPIPDTSEVSLIMLNQTMFRPVEDRFYTHVWYHSEEQFMEELFLRVRMLVYVPVKREWKEYLYRAGQRTFVRQFPMCDRLTYMGPAEKGIQRNWMSAGFSIAYIYADREAWEKVISDGLRTRQIEI